METRADLTLNRRAVLLGLGSAALVPLAGATASFAPAWAAPAADRFLVLVLGDIAPGVIASPLYSTFHFANPTPEGVAEAMELYGPEARIWARTYPNGKREIFIETGLYRFMDGGPFFYQFREVMDESEGEAALLKRLARMLDDSYGAGDGTL